MPITAVEVVDESGTAPEDRTFRPDVEGLRAIAVLLVVLYHSGVPGLSGGFVGVDVFFVISGFVITGVLLRDREKGGPSILSFYGRRSRRILPAATLVIIASALLAYWFLGVGGGNQTAIDGRWAAVFLANYHFISTGTNYLASGAPPSPLQNFWSLAVEEQFYVVYPTLFLLMGASRRLTFRLRLAIALSAVIALSLGYSILDTRSNSVNAFFSPFTRAWELALGALVAVITPWLLSLPVKLAAIATWVGFVGVLIAAHIYNSHTPYPGAYVVLPVVGTSMIIAGGVHAQHLGVERVLGLRPFRWFGKLSYSLYLWHWPILIVAAEYAGRSTLSVADNIGWDLVALVVSLVTYRLVENPIRHSVRLHTRRWASVGLGVGLVLATLVLLTLLIGIGPSTDAATLPNKVPLVQLPTVLHSVAESDHVHAVPSDLSPTLLGVQENILSHIGFPPAPCDPGWAASSVPACTFGDERARRTVVLYGDSHAGMWFDALDGITIRQHWRLVVLFKSGCPASLVSIPPSGSTSGVWGPCNLFHQFALHRIATIKPQILIVSESFRYLEPNGTLYPIGQWQASIAQLLDRFSSPRTHTILIGNPAEPADGTPGCLSRHLDDVTACSGVPYSRAIMFNRAENRAAHEASARFINILPWFCTNRCNSIVSHYLVYLRNDHVSRSYSLFLEGVLGTALDLDHAMPRPAASRAGSRT